MGGDDGFGGLGAAAGSGNSDAFDTGISRLRAICAVFIVRAMLRAITDTGTSGGAGASDISDG